MEWITRHEILGEMRILGGGGGGGGGGGILLLVMVCDENFNNIFLISS